MRKANCISCGQGLIDKGAILMPCPSCATPVGRCGECREQAVVYTCGGCGFLGP